MFAPLSFIKIGWRLKINNNFNTEVLFNDVVLYKKALPNPSTLIKILERSKLKETSENTHFSKWTGWYGFGDQVAMPWLPPAKNIEEIINNNFSVYNKDLLIDEDEEKYFAKVVSSVFYSITKDYMSRTKDLPLDWTPMGVAVCRYEVIETQELGMAYHTDYVQSKIEAPGYKFSLTCTMYINDDYKGGEILFLNTDTTEVIEYAPYAGDVIVFPSGEPYYHGVNKILEGQKYIIRLFWGYDFPGTEEWHKNQELYGKEEWEKIESAEIKKHFHEGTYHKEVVWDPEELNHERFIKGEKPTVTSYLSKYPLIKKGRNNE